MDRDLAIKVIKRMIKTGIAYDDGYAYEPLTNDEKEALDMAIKALEEPCEDMEGKIEKEYLFESLCEDLKKLQKENEQLSSELEKNSQKLEKDLPQEPKTGHWIENEKQTHVEKIYHCSECGFEAWGEWERTNYCGGCGAKMSEVKHD